MPKSVYEIRDAATERVVGYVKCQCSGRWYFSPPRSSGRKGNGKFYPNLEAAVPLDAGPVIVRPHRHQGSPHALAHA